MCEIWVVLDECVDDDNFIGLTGLVVDILDDETYYGGPVWMVWILELHQMAFVPAESQVRLPDPYMTQWDEHVYKIGTADADSPSVAG